jgi:hypothetical protein
MPEHNQSLKEFTPWHIDYRFALIWYAGGVVSSWLLVMFGSNYLAVGAAVWSLFRGWSRARRGMARERDDAGAGGLLWRR